MGSSAQPLTLSDEPVENHRALRVRIIGAGFSGVYLGIRIPQRLRNVDLRIYDKNAGIGGTWFENRYPGCACDIPSHSYQYSFAPNLEPGWSGFYAPAREICDYIQRTARRFGADRFVRLEHKVTDLRWDDEGKKWWVLFSFTRCAWLSVADVFDGTGISRWRDSTRVRSSTMRPRW